MLEQRRRRQRTQSGLPDGQLDLLSWTMLYRRMLTPGRPFDLSAHPYLADIYGCGARRAVIYKASQMGASEYAVSYVLHAADQRGATVLYIFPTDRHVSDFSSARIGPAIEASPYLAGVVIEGSGADGKRGADRVTLKRIGDRFLYLRGAQVGIDGSAPQLKSIDADLIVLDEVDEMDGRAPAIAQKRLGHSSIGEERWISTPTYPGQGIHAAWLESDQQEWHVRCDGCGEWQPLTINQVVTEFDKLGRPVHWYGETESAPRAWVACRKCRRELDRWSSGQWVATYPGRATAGFHLTKLFSRQADLLEIVRALQTTDETKRRETFNQDLGEPYKPRGAGLDAALLDGLRRDYAHAPVKGERTVMGVDVGKLLNVVIRGPAGSETGERRQRWAGEVEDFDGLKELIRRYHVGVCVIDALPETREARRFQAAVNAGRLGLVWLAYYVSGAEGSKKAEPAEWKQDEGTVSIDRTRLLDETMSRFLDGTNTLPGHARSLRDYYAHLTALVRVTETGRDGSTTARYVETGPDHYGHAENYCTAAGMAPRRPIGLLAQASAQGW
jgi:hypothetical protein